MPLALVSPSGDRRFVLPEGSTLVLGRETTCDLPILDPGVSRRHAEIRVSGNLVVLQDLSSRNGTWLNGQRVGKGQARIGDLIAFGPVELAVVEESSPRTLDTAPFALDGAATMVRERAMPTQAEAVEAVAGKRLAQLVAVAQRLGGLARLEALLSRIVDDAFEAFDADRVAVLMVRDDDQTPASTLPTRGGSTGNGPDVAVSATADSDVATEGVPALPIVGELETRVARDRLGADLPRPVPRSIVNGVAQRQVSWLLHDASRDARVSDEAVGDSVIQQAVRSALAAPLIGEGRRTLGVLYVDNLRDVNAFTEADLDFLVAYAGIAAAAMEREQSVERLREATRVRENFQRYFTPQLADRIASAQGDVVLGGDRRPVIVLFSDIRGFTEVAESLPPDQMAAQLNEYFAAMVECVFRHDGALDKFIGDALMAYWGAPVSAADDADRAIRAALDMQSELEKLNARWVADGRSALHAGIGINAGDAFVGNIGSPQRLEYTLIGDTVNLANRLCGLARGGEVLVSDAVRRLSTGSVPLRARPDLVPERFRGPAVDVFSVERAMSHQLVATGMFNTPLTSPPAHGGEGTIIRPAIKRPPHDT
jgi:adenylate cyclase